jgi:ubiquinol-cytochrome c reductase iron-sulfur subunit
MTDATDRPEDGAESGGQLADGHGDGGQRRQRIIGTPAPAKARVMLGPESASAAPGAPRELPADPGDPVRAKKAERAVAACFGVAGLAGLAFLAAYFIFPVHSVDGTMRSNLALGGTLGVALLALGAGAVLWVRHLMPWVEITEQRHPLRSSPEDRAAFAKTFREGAEASQFVKRPILRRTLIAATVPLGLAPLILLRDTGPLPHKSLEHTVWRKGLRLLTYGPNTPIRAADFSSQGEMITVVPEGYEEDFDALAKAAVIIMRLPPGALQHPTNLNWTVDNIVAYSKICTHVGCPAALYEQTTHHILCPCHQSTFDAARGAQVTFGPATRALPQLPMGVDSNGYLVALGDFTEPVGPSYWERS